jgi:hypothetical protein
LKEAGMVPAFHSKAVSHGKNVQATNSRAGTVHPCQTQFFVLYIFCYNVYLCTVHIKMSMIKQKERREGHQLFKKE